MKRIINNLEKQFKNLVDLIKKRDNKVNGMSKKWQYSNKCAEFMYRTHEIQAEADKLEDLVSDLSTLLINQLTKK